MAEEEQPLIEDAAKLNPTEEVTEEVVEEEPWTFLSQIKMNDLYLVAKYRSTSSKIEVIHAAIPGPHVSCYIVIPHILEDDLGLPHMLQRMIFQGGSKNFPQAGLIQQIANRSFSSGLKSWVERDHSCFYFTTAGKAGCEQMLPVVFDHIFSPRIQEASFLQEVYHVQGDGTDYGACLEEMIRLEQDADAIATIELIKTILGEDSAYRFSCMGSSKLLREQELKLVDKIKAFHDKFYHLANCCLVITGDITKQDLVPMLDTALEFGVTKKKSKKDPGPWKKPWENQPIVEPIQEPVLNRFQYPCENGEQGGVHVKIGILGPPSTEKLNRCVAMRLALEYLAEGPLYQAVAVNKTRKSIHAIGQTYFDEEYLSSKISISEYELKQTLFCINCYEVPRDMVQSVRYVLRRAMEDHVTYDFEFDYERMVQVVHRFYNYELTSLETRVEEKICRNIIPEYLYGAQDSELMFDRRINSAYTIHHFLNQPAEFWKLVIQECLLGAYWVTIAAVPSRAMFDDILEENANRLQLRMEPTHIKETKRLAQRYKASVKLFASQKSIVKTEEGDVLEKFALPPIDSIGFTHIKRQENPPWAAETLCNLYVDDVHSSYVFLTIIMDTTELTLEERKYLVLFAEGILNSPFIDSADEFHSAEEMEVYLQRDCLNYETFFGLEWLGKIEERTSFSCGSFPHLFCLRFQLDTSKIHHGFYWAQNLLWNTKWQPDKLKTTCQTLVLKVDDQLKKLGPVMTKAMLTDSLYLMNSTPKAASLIRQKMFLRKVGEELPKSMRRVSQMLEGIRMTLLRPENCTVHVAGSLNMMEYNLTEDPNDSDAIAKLFRSTFDYTGWHWGYDTKRLSNAFDMNVMRSAECIAKCSREQILRMDTVDDGFLIQCSSGIRSWQDWDYPLLLTTLQYFIQPDGGPLYKEIVLAKLADEVDIRVNPSEGLIYFEMRRCPDIALAYGKVFEVMAKHCVDDTLNSNPNSYDTADDDADDEEEEAEEEVSIWDENLLISAKSSMIYKLAAEESTPYHVAMLSLLGYYKRSNQIGKARRQLMEKIVATTLNQVSQITLKYLKPLFLQPCTCAASVPKEKAIGTIQKLMEACGKRLTLIPPVEHSALASYNQ